jgi:UTP-glucose-1-phosphate uridylyltransferase
LIGVVQVDDVTRYGNIMIENNRIKSIIQKPKNNNTGSKFVYWGKAILNRAFWNKFSGNLDSAFIGEQVYELRSTPYDTGNLFDYAKANSDFTYKNRS